MITKKQLKLAADELIKVLQLAYGKGDEGGEEGSPIVIDPETNEEDLKVFVVKAINYIEKGDKFSKPVQAIIDELKEEADEPKKEVKKETKAAKVPAAKAKKDDVEETKEDPAGEDTELEDQIDDADLEELKDIVDENAKFKSLRKSLATFVKAGELRKVMKALLVAPAEEEVKPTKKEVAAAKAPVAKTTPAPAAKKEAKPAAKKSEKTDSYTRIDAVCVALQNEKPKTIQEWIDASDVEYEANGGKVNPQESRTMVKYAHKVLGHFGVAVPKE